MKRPYEMMRKTLLMSILSAGLGLYAGTVASTPTDNGVGHSSAKSSPLETQLYLDGDKPPYVRDTRMQQENKGQLEKGEFARLEEKPAVTKEEQQPMYRYVPGAKPPYERIP